MKPAHPQQAKIVNHDSGLGVPDADTVRRRASELALINSHEEPTTSDWRQAKQELHGGHETSASNGDAPMIESSGDLIVGSLGHQAERVTYDDAENAVEELIAEGMDEAVHEQMLEAARDGEAEAEE